MAYPVETTYCKRCDGKGTIEETDTWAIVPCPECQKKESSGMERRFVIKECPATGDSHYFSITKPELKQRLRDIIGGCRVIDDAIQILLTGGKSNRGLPA